MQYRSRMEIDTGGYLSTQEFHFGHRGRIGFVRVGPRLSEWHLRPFRLSSPYRRCSRLRSGRYQHGSCRGVGLRLEQAVAYHLPERSAASKR